MAQFDVYSTSVQNIISWIKSGEVAIPEIQRPFVWDSTKVRDLLDSLYNGFPVGYIIVSTTGMWDCWMICPKPMPQKRRWWQKVRSLKRWHKKEHGGREISASMQEQLLNFNVFTNCPYGNSRKPAPVSSSSTILCRTLKNPALCESVRS